MAFSAFTTTPSILTQTVGGPVIDKNYNVTVGHTFALGEAVYIDSSGSVIKAKADSLTTSYTVGIVKGLDTSTVTIGYQGEFTVASSVTGYFPLATGNVYYLSPTIAGGITATSPTSSSLVVQPLFVASGSYTGIVINSIPRQNYGFTSLYTPVGTMVPFGGKANNIPGNWVLCAGDALPKGTTSTDSYYDLYSAIGEKYGVHGVAQSNSTGLTAYITFDSAVEDAPTYGSGLPGSTKNFSLLNNSVYKITWGTKQAVARVASATGSTSNVTFTFLAGITGATSSFSGLVQATEITLNSLIAGEVAGYTSDNFFLPDFRGRMAIGAGRGINLTNRSLGAFGGEETHTLTNSELPSHRHTIPLRNSSGISGSAQYVLGGATGSVNAVLSTDLQTNSAVSDLTGGGQAHENMSPFLTANWIIRYKSNVGQPGIEIGPKGDQGIQGSVGSTGATGVVGATGATGYASGTITYRYTPLTTPPNGYWNETSGYLRVSAQEDSNTNIASYIQTWDDSNAGNKGIVFIRDAYNSPSFFRIYNITGVSTTGSVGGVDYYQFPVSSLVYSGTGTSGQA
jgi:microcystin-dependent protein